MAVRPDGSREKSGVEDLAGGPVTRARQGKSYTPFDDVQELVHDVDRSTHDFVYSYDKRHQLVGTYDGVGMGFGADYQYGDAGRLEYVRVDASAWPNVPSREVNYDYSGTSDIERLDALKNIDSSSCAAYCRCSTEQWCPGAASTCDTLRVRARPLLLAALVSSAALIAQLPIASACSISHTKKNERWTYYGAVERATLVLRAIPVGAARRDLNDPLTMSSAIRVRVVEVIKGPKHKVAEVLEVERLFLVRTPGFAMRRPLFLSSPDPCWSSRKDSGLVLGQEYLLSIFGEKMMSGRPVPLEGPADPWLQAARRYAKIAKIRDASQRKRALLRLQRIGQRKNATAVERAVGNDARAHVEDHLTP